MSITQLALKLPLNAKFDMIIANFFNERCFMSSQIIQPIKSLRGSISLPGDKSISHRSLILASLAEGDSQIKNLLLAEDVLATLRILQQLGVSMSHRPDEIRPGDTLVVHGVGLRGLKHTKEILDCGNSGTSMRLLLGLLAAQPFESTLTGDDSLNRRPMDRVIKPLTEMGARFSITQKDGKRLIKVKGSKYLKKSTVHHLPVATAQVKSAILLAGLYAPEETLVVEPSLSRDHTERMMTAAGVKLMRKGSEVMVYPVESLKPLNLTIPGDFSSAAFFLVGGLIIPDSEIALKAVGVNPTRAALIDILREMGGEVQVQKEHLRGDEPVADLLVQSSPLRVRDIGGDVIPKMIDEIPIFAIAAARAKGKTTISDAAELRVKESDRISVLAAELLKLGVPVEEKGDGLIIEGGFPFKEGTFESHGDHRIAMSLAIAALSMRNPSTILNTGCISTSFPTFFQKIDELSS